MTRRYRLGLTAIAVGTATLFLVPRSSPSSPAEPAPASSPAAPPPLPLLATTIHQPPPPSRCPIPPTAWPMRVGVVPGTSRQIFTAAGITYPAREVYLRVFKSEGEIELWARSGPDDTPFRLVTTYPVLCASGRLGPKRREGDGQVPEGFYTVDRFNPRSLFHLSLGLDYPTPPDRLLTTDPEHPGTDIFIHGDAQSIGCLAMGDAVAEEIYLAAADARTEGGKSPPVHIFPCRMTAGNWDKLLAPLCAGQPALESLWRSLRAGYEAFEQTRRVPAARVDAEGRYLLE